MARKQGYSRKKNLGKVIGEAQTQTNRTQTIPIPGIDAFEIYKKYNPDYPYDEKYWSEVTQKGVKGTDGREWRIREDLFWEFRDEGQSWIVTDVKAQGPEGEPLTYDKLTSAQKEELAMYVTLQGGRIQAVDPGVLPAGPTGQTRHMVVTATGTWTYGGATIGTNAEGYQTTFWWDGSDWSNNGSVKVKGDIYFNNNSYNEVTTGIIIYNSKLEAREATPIGIRKRGLVITYRAEGIDGWVTEQYVGTSNPNDWDYSDNSFIDINKTASSGVYITYSGFPTYDQSTRILSIPAGVISTSDGRRVDTIVNSFVIETGFTRLVSSRSGVLKTIPINTKLNTFLSYEEINIATFYLSGTTGVLKVLGDNFPLFGQSIKEADERIAIVNNSAAQINFDLTNRLLKITGGALIDNNAITNGRINLPTTEIEIPSSIPSGVVLYNKSDNTVVIRNQADRPLKNHYVLFTYIYSGTLASFNVNGLQNYFVNGTKVMPTQERYALLNVDKDDVNFDLPNRLISFGGGAVIHDTGNTGRYNLSGKSISMIASATNAVVLFNTSTEELLVRNQASLPISGCLALFTYQYTGDPTKFVVNGIDNYTVNGVSNHILDLRTQKFFSVDNFGIQYWNAPIQDSADVGDVININNLKTTELYPMYDYLVDNFSSNVTKTIVGETDSGFDVLRLDISFNRKSETLNRRRKPKIFLCGGIHGGENLSVYTTYLFVKNLLENPNNDEILNVLRTNYDWTIMPLVNPFALDVGVVGGVQSVRWNHNGVDINRNFDYRWEAFADGGIGSQTYKGTSAFSEKESQFVRDVFNDIKNDVVLFIDCHNYGGSSMGDKRCAWFATSTDMAQNIIMSLCDRLDFEFKKRYSYIPKNHLSAFCTMDLSSPMSQAWINNQQVLSYTLETDRSDSFNTPITNNNSNVITRSLETYVNSLYSLSKDAVELANLILK